MTNPYASPNEEQLANANELEQPGHYGGVTRGVYFWIMVGLTLVRLPFNGTQMEPLVIVGSAFLMVVFTGYRCVNVGMKFIWCLGVVVPLLNLFVLARCLVCQTGYMKQKRLDGTGRIAFGVFIVFFLLALFAALAP